MTVGGAIAADVHGKNHHQVGSLGNFILELRLLLADGSEVICSPQQMPDLFWATIGGMGLTGVITAARIQLCAFRPPLFRSTIDEHAISTKRCAFLPKKIISTNTRWPGSIVWPKAVRWVAA